MTDYPTLTNGGMIGIVLVLVCFLLAVLVRAPRD